MAAILPMLLEPIAPALHFVGLPVPGQPRPWTAGRIARLAGSAVATGGLVAGGVIVYGKLAAIPPSAPSPLADVVAPDVLAALAANGELLDAAEALLMFRRADVPAFDAVLHAASRVAALLVALGDGTQPWSPATPRLYAEYAYAVGASLRVLSRAVPPAMRLEFTSVDDAFMEALTNARYNVQREAQYRMERRPRGRM